MNNEMKNSIALYLATKYLANHESSHCTPLPLNYIREPWNEFKVIKQRNDDDFDDYYSPRN
jgi:hypothetical protein